MNSSSICSSMLLGTKRRPRELRPRSFLAVASPLALPILPLTMALVALAEGLCRDARCFLLGRIGDASAAADARTTRGLALGLIEEVAAVPARGPLGWLCLSGLTTMDAIVLRC